MSASAAVEIKPARAWLLASRPATLPAAAVPVFVGAGAAISEGARLRPLVFAVTLVCALLIQVGTNFANDYSDFHRGADHDGRLGPVRVTQSGLITQAGVRRGIVVAFGAAALLGFWLAWIGGWPIIVIGVLSILSGLAYTGVETQAAASYTAWQVLTAAVTATKSLDDKVLADWLKKNKVDTIQGKLRFDGPSNYGDDLMRVKQVQNGKWVVVWPKSAAAPGVTLQTN